ncbi:hypothetical protein DBV15_05148 [Temnothorax longispinosus]|uniref:Uncharacterized protein n=1 Tax=Temnothorax longispinosus TaxID=300112 RepID=A0A4S2KUD8_9HYME|nr:hypothetical protein DBV15_05148 [Temnothorax longispinosus]
MACDVSSFCATALTFRFDAQNMRVVSTGQEKFQPYLESKLEPLALLSPSARNGTGKTETADGRSGNGKCRLSREVLVTARVEASGSGIKRGATSLIKHT